MTAPVLTAHERRRRAIARSQERRAVELAPLLERIDELVHEVGWSQARPVVEGVMAPIRVTGPRGVWRSRMGRRTGARLVAGLSALPAQEHLELGRALHLRRNLGAEGGKRT